MTVVDTLQGTTLHTVGKRTLKRMPKENAKKKKINHLFSAFHFCNQTRDGQGAGADTGLQSSPRHSRARF